MITNTMYRGIMKKIRQHEESHLLLDCIIDTKHESEDSKSVAHIYELFDDR